MNRFLNEDNGLQMAFLDGNQPDRVCAPMAEYIESQGGSVQMNAPLKEIVTHPDGSVKHLVMRDGSVVKGALFFSFSTFIFLLSGFRIARVIDF